MMYSPQGPYPAQEPSGAVPYPSQSSYSPQQSFGAVPYTSQDLYPAQQAFEAYSPQSSYPVQQSFEMLPYAPQRSYVPQKPLINAQSYEAPRNLQAKRAIINGLISLVLSVFTLVTLAGFAGLITATLAIVYGFLGLRVAKQLPNTMGRRQAAIGLGLGCVAWLVVILSLIVRAAS
jgi:hypothetical protein